MKEFEIIEVTADTGIIAYGETMEKLMENAAKGMSFLMIDPQCVAPSLEQKVVLFAENYEDLLYKWLSELIYLFDARGFIPIKFKVSLNAQDDKLRLEATVGGEFMDRNRHNFKLGIKAVTFHQMKIQKNNLFHTKIIFDV